MIYFYVICHTRATCEPSVFIVGLHTQHHILEKKKGMLASVYYLLYLVICLGEMMGYRIGNNFLRVCCILNRMWASGEKNAFMPFFEMSSYTAHIGQTTSALLSLVCFIFLEWIVFFCLCHTGADNDKHVLLMYAHCVRLVTVCRASDDKMMFISRALDVYLAINVHINNSNRQFGVYFVTWGADIVCPLSPACVCQMNIKDI